MSRRLGKALLALLLAGAAPVCLGERSLAQALGELTTRLQINFVVEPGVEGGPGPGADLDQPVPDHVDSLETLEQWLNVQALTLKTLDNGDRVIRPLRRGRLALSALPVRATPMADFEPVAAPTASNTRLDADLLDALGSQTMEPLFSRAANVYGSPGEYYIRGIPSRGDLNTLGNASAQIGAAPLPDLLLGQLPLTTWDLQSAGFTRGTLASAAGGPFSSYAGRVSLVPSAPAFENQAAVRISSDHRGGFGVAGLLNRPLLDDELAVRTSVDHQHFDGRLRDPSGATFDSASARTVRLGLLWEPARWPASRWAMELNHLSGKTGPRRIAVDHPDDRSGSSAPFNRQDLSGWTAVADVSLEAGSGQLWQVQAVATRGRSVLTPTRSLSNTFDPAYRLVDEERSALQSVQVNWRRQRDVWTLGASLSVGRQDLDDRLIRDQRNWRLEKRLTRVSADLDAQWSLSTAWSADARLRWTRDRLRRDCASTRIEDLVEAGTEAVADDCFEAIGLLLIPASGGFEAFAEGYSQWSPELTVRYQHNPQRRFFARMLRGFNAGGAVSSARFSGEPFWISYAPEQARTAELGWQEDQGSWQAVLTAFHTSLRGQWTAIQGSAFLEAVGNTGQSRSYGLELDARVKPSARHTVDLSAGWLDTRYRQFTPFERDAQFEPVAGNRFPGAPRYSGALTWRARLNESWLWTLAANYHGPVEANANNPDSARIPGRVVVDARLAWQRGAVTVSARMDNLLNRNYQLTTPDVSRRTQRIDYLPGPSRTFGLVLELDFN